MTTKRKAAVFSLMARCNQTSRLLPKPDEFDTRDATIMAEMNKLRLPLNALLAKPPRTPLAIRVNDPRTSA